MCAESVLAPLQKTTTTKRNKQNNNKKPPWKVYPFQVNLKFKQQSKKPTTIKIDKNKQELKTKSITSDKQ